MSENISAAEQKKHDRNASEILESIRQQMFGGHQFCRARFPLPILETSAALLVEHYGYGQCNARLAANEINMVYGVVRVYSRTLPVFFDAWSSVAMRSNDPAVGKTLELGHQEWEQATDLPAFRSERDWRAVAVKVGAGDDLIRRAIVACEPEALGELVERVVAFVSTSTPPTTEPQVCRVSEATSLPNNPTCPITKGVAAAAMGYDGNAQSKVRRLNTAIKDGLPCVKMSRQQFVFSCDSFPREAQDRIRKNN